MPTPLPTANLRLRGPVLLPAGEDKFTFTPDALVLTDAAGVVTYAGGWSDRPAAIGSDIATTPVSLLIPPLLDCHIHIPQHPIRGRFVEGVPANAPGGQLLAGLARNIYPAEGACAEPGYAVGVIKAFLEETRDNGTLGGVAYMTAHPAATRAALEILPASWRVGLVLMDINCPASLSITPEEATAALDGLARDFGQRLVITDRFAVACSTPLRQAGVAIARKYGLETQTHLAEQPGELATIRELYPDAESYTHLYDSDGLLAGGLAGTGALLAHCIHLSESEWQLLSRRRARVAHCPISNTLLHSGVMPLEQIYAHDLDYALCTDVGASPTTSLLAEMTHFLQIHNSVRATPEAALYRTTIAAKRVGRIEIGGLRESAPFAAIEVRATRPQLDATSGEVISQFLLAAKDQDISTIARSVSGRIGRLWR